MEIIEITNNVTNRVGVANLRTLQWMRLSKTTLKRREMKAKPMQTTRSRMGTSSTLCQPETIEAEDHGGEGAAGPVHVSVGACMANANATRNHNGQLKK